MFKPRRFSLKKLEKHVQTQFPSANAMARFFEQVFEDPSTSGPENRNALKRRQDAEDHPVAVALQDLVIVHNLLTIVGNKGKGKWRPDGKQELEFPHSQTRDIWQALKTWHRILLRPQGPAILFRLCSPIPHGPKFARHVIKVMNEYKFGDRVLKAMTPYFEATNQN